MTAQSIFLSLGPRERARVAIAVLLDGGDAPLYLMNDHKLGSKFRAAAEELLAMELDVRFPYLGTMLRLALEEGA
jgi:hypothetical protein